MRHEANLVAIEIARNNGTEVHYNPAPWRGGIPCLEFGIDLLVVNEIEVIGLLGREIVAQVDRRPQVRYTEARPSLE